MDPDFLNIFKKLQDAMNLMMKDARRKKLNISKPSDPNKNSVIYERLALSIRIL